MIETRKADMKHWVGKSTPKIGLRLENYGEFANQAFNTLGINGIVGIPNARGEGHFLKTEYRCEELFNIALEQNREEIEGYKEKNSFYFYDKKRKIYIVKGQEIRPRDVPVTLLIYGLPYEINLAEGALNSILDQAAKFESIIGITGPSCIGNLEKVLSNNPNLLKSLDFFVGWSGGAKSKKDNQKALNFYKENLKERKKGLIAVSGGHRTLTIGKSYTELLIDSEKDFIEGLREGLKTSPSLEVFMKKEMNGFERYQHGLSLKVADPIRKVFGRY